MTKPSRFWLLSLLCLSLLGLVVSDGWTAETFAFKQAPGTTAKYQREQKTDQVLTIAGMDIETKSSSFAMLSFAAGEKAADESLEVTERYDVLQSELSIVGMTYQFDSANPDQAPPAGFEPVANIVRATFQTPVTTVYAGDGSVREVKIPAEKLANIDPMFAELFNVDRRKKSASQQREMLPKKAVDVGDTWEQTIDAELGGGQTLTFGLKYEYTGPVQENGQTLQRVQVRHASVAYRMDPNSPSPLKITDSELAVKETEGEILFDNARGVIVREGSKVVIEGTLKLLAGGQELPGKLALTLSSKNVLQP